MSRRDLLIRWAFIGAIPDDRKLGESDLLLRGLRIDPRDAAHRGVRAVRQRAGEERPLQGHKELHGRWGVHGRRRRRFRVRN
jgi:hypothetical protein